MIDNLDKLKPGAVVTFADANATVSSDEMGVARGTVNGPLKCLLEDSDEPTHIPVWAERDNGREPTTILVYLENILGVE